MSFAISVDSGIGMNGQNYFYIQVHAWMVDHCVHHNHHHCSDPFQLAGVLISLVKLAE